MLGYVDCTQVSVRTILNPVGSIAKKIGIEWGNAWTNAIDRPYFEVKANWLLPKGYKLEGQINVPTNSRGQVQLIMEDKKEEIEVTNTNKVHWL